jgi:hypothetical protein
MRESVGFLESAHDITDVVIVFRHSFYLFGDQTKSYPHLPRVPEFLRDLPPSAARAVYLASFTEIVRRLSASGKRVYVVKPIPDLSINVERYIFTDYRPEMSNKPTGASLEYYHARNRLILTSMDELKKLPNVTLLDPVASFCGRDQCASIIDGNAMYVDDNHLSVEGARRFIAAQRASGALALP